jgi:cytochrome b
MTAGPLNRHVSSAVGQTLTEVHEFNAGVLLTLVGVHVAAVLFHLVYRRDNLILPMLTGRAPWDGPEADTRAAPLWLAVVVAVAAAGAVWWLVR